MKVLISFIVAILMTSCTYSISMAHTEGLASDVIDETSTITPQTSISVPVSGV